MADRMTDELTDHNYDDIQEYDNPTPGWWHMVFIGSIIFSVLYFVVFHMTSLVPTREARIISAAEAEAELLFGEIKDLPAGTEKLLTVMGDQKWLDRGLSIYKAKCQSCHAEGGKGLVGPNMTDDSYKNVKTLLDFPDVIANGAAKGAMPAQKNVLSENEIYLVAGYMASLRGTNVPGKAAEGEVIDPWPTAAP